MKNIVKSQRKNLNGSIESIKLSNNVNVSKSDVIRNINDGSETYSTLSDDKKIHVVEGKYLRTDKHMTKSDDLGELSTSISTESIDREMNKKIENLEQMNKMPNNNLGEPSNRRM